MDDLHTHHADPVCSWAALCTFRTMARAHCRLRSNLDKLAVHSPNADLSFLPASVPGSPSQPVRGLKVMGAFISNDEEWISNQLVSMVPKKLANLKVVIGCTSGVMAAFSPTCRVAPATAITG